MMQPFSGFLKTERVGVLAVEMSDGAPHAATVHFAHIEDPLTFIFLTDRNYRKSEPFLTHAKTRASFVVGFSEEKELQKTLQFDGEARLSDDPALKASYLEKFPEKKKHDGPDDIFLSFAPSWWRFTDWTLPSGKTVYCSDGTMTVKK